MCEILTISNFRPHMILSYRPILPSSVVVRLHVSTEVPGSIPGGGSVTDTISQ